MRREKGFAADLRRSRRCALLLVILSRSKLLVILSRSKRRKELRACRRIPVLCPSRCCIKAFSPKCFGRTSNKIAKIAEIAKDCQN